MNEQEEELKVIKKRIADMMERAEQLEGRVQEKPRGGRSNPIDENGNALRPNKEAKQ